MTSLGVTPFEDKTARAFRRRFWLTTAALGRPEIPQDTNSGGGLWICCCGYRLSRETEKLTVPPLQYLWFQRCKYKLQDFWMWCVIWGMEGAGCLTPPPLYPRSSRFPVCHSVRSSGGRWRPALPTRAAHPPLPLVALEGGTYSTIMQTCLSAQRRQWNTKLYRKYKYDQSHMEASQKFPCELLVWTTVSENHLSLHRGLQFSPQLAIKSF